MPESLNKEEFLWIRFVEEEKEKVRIKTKTLKLIELEFNVMDEVCDSMSIQENCPINTRSIFAYSGDKYLEQFESLKSFMDHQ